MIRLGLSTSAVVDEEVDGNLEKKIITVRDCKVKRRISLVNKEIQCEWTN
jgi:hypothetical protein